MQECKNAQMLERMNAERPDRILAFLHFCILAFVLR
jgi:hypothetical protein